MGSDLSMAMRDLAQRFGAFAKRLAGRHGEFSDVTAQNARRNAEALAGDDTTALNGAKTLDGALHRGADPSQAGHPGSGPGGDPSLRTDDPGNNSTTAQDDKTCRSDPVDVVTGEVVMAQTDAVLPGVLELVLERVYASGYSKGRLFGARWASTLDQRVQADAEGVHFAAADGRVLHYPVPVDSREEVLPPHGASWPLAWNRETDEITIRQPETGRTLHFPPGQGPGRGQSRHLSAISDRNGHRASIVRNPDGIPTGVFHTGGYRLDVDSVVTAAGPRIRGLSLAGPAGEAGTPLATYGYDALGRLTDIADSSGAALLLEYDRDDRLTRWTDRAGGSFGYHYGRDGRVDRAEGVGGVQQAGFAYDPDGRVTTVTDSLGAVTAYHWNELRQVVKTVDPLGGTTLTEHDRYGRVLSHTDELGRVLRVDRDEDGNPVRVERRDGTVVGAVYNDIRKATEVVGPDGAVWRFTYDDRGNLLTATDPRGALSRFEYGDRGELLASTDALGHRTAFQTNSAGLPTEVIDALGAVTRAARDRFGRITEVTDPLGAVTTYAWTVEGAPVRRVAADGAAEEWTHDAAGRILTHTDPLGGVTAFEHAAAGGVLAARVDPTGARFEFGHDTELRLTSVADPAGKVWRYAYDPAGNLTSETDFDDRTLAYRHDAAGRLVERVNGAGQATTLLWDAADNVVERSTGDGVFRFDYDRGGRLAAARGPSGSVTWRYDAAGRMLSEEADGHTVGYDHDALGRRTGRTTPSGLHSLWSFDAAGRPAALATDAGRLGFAHDAAGRETTRSLGPAAWLAQEYDVVGRLAGQRIWTGDQRSAASGAGTSFAGPDARLLQQRSYTYRADGTPTEIADAVRGTRRYQADGLGRVTTVSAATWTESYAYDSAGNVAKAHGPGPGPGPDNADSDTAGDRETSGTLIRSAGRTHYEHDSQGRLTRTVRRTLSGGRKEWHYAWDADDHLTRATLPDGTVWTYDYDPLGRRTAKTRLTADGTIAERIRFTWEGLRLAEQSGIGDDGTIETLTWDYEPDSWTPVAQTRRTWATGASRQLVDEAFHAVVTDLTGAPTELLTPDGDLAWHTVTSLWGRVIAAPQSDADCPLRFPGQYHDDETGLHYNLHRYYDPDTAAFLSADPLGLAGGPNDHAYVDNPLTWIDPLGLAQKGPADPCEPGGATNVPTQFGPAAGTSLEDAVRAQEQRHTDEIIRAIEERGQLYSGLQDLGATGIDDATGHPGSLGQPDHLAGPGHNIAVSVEGLAALAIVGGQKIVRRIRRRTKP
jgi:RHS repeat-associated protein